MKETFNFNSSKIVQQFRFRWTASIKDREKKNERTKTMPSRAGCGDDYRTPEENAVCLLVLLNYGDMGKASNY